MGTLTSYKIQSWKKSYYSKYIGTLASYETQTHPKLKLIFLPADVS